MFIILGSLEIQFFFGIVVLHKIYQKKKYMEREL